MAAQGTALYSVSNRCDDTFARVIDIENNLPVQAQPLTNIAPASITVPPAQATYSSDIPADVEAKIREDAEEAFPNDYQLQLGDIENQEDAYRQLYQ